MPITAWKCPGCHREVPLDHYETTKCGATVCHPDYARAILRDNEDRYVKDQVTVTVGLGCPRSRAIENDLPVAVNPLEFNALLIGRAWDQLLENHSPAGTSKVVVKGTIAGVEIWGEIDRVRELTNGEQTYLAIEDHKHGNNFQQRFAKKDVESGKPVVKPEQAIQTSIYAELYAQQEGVRPTHGVIWQHYSGAPGPSNAVLTPHIYLLWSVADCLAHKPYNGEYTVEQLYKMADRYEKWKRGGAAIRVEALDLPLVGKTMSFGTKEFCDYCEVRDTCFTADRGAPF